MIFDINTTINNFKSFQMDHSSSKFPPTMILYTYDSILWVYLSSFILQWDLWVASFMFKKCLNLFFKEISILSYHTIESFTDGGEQQLILLKLQVHYLITSDCIAAISYYSVDNSFSSFDMMSYVSNMTSVVSFSSNYSYNWSKIPPISLSW